MEGIALPRAGPPGRRAPRGPGAPLLLLVALLVALAPVPVLEFVPPDGGPPRWQRPVYPGFRFSLAYTHSIFGVPVTEEFRISPTGQLVLTGIRSSDGRIEGYYDIPGARAEPGPRGVRIGGLNLPHRRLPVRGTRIGGRTYDDGVCTARLADLAGEWGAVTLRVAVRPLALYLADRRRGGCPNGMT